jgi:hypothetical protein
MSGLNIIQTLTRNPIAGYKLNIFCFVSEHIISLPRILYIQKRHSQGAVGGFHSSEFVYTGLDLGVAEMKSNLNLVFVPSS